MPADPSARFISARDARRATGWEFLLVGLTSVILAQQANAGVAAYSYSGGNESIAPSTIGVEFTPTVDILVDALGVYDSVIDCDGDLMPDDFELSNGFDTLNAIDANMDADADGFTNLEEFEAGTNPLDAADAPGAIKVPVSTFILLGED